MYMHVYRCAVNPFQMADLQTLIKKREELLKHQNTEVMNKIRLTARFWATLVKYNVIKDYEIENIKVRWKTYSSYHYFFLHHTWIERQKDTAVCILCTKQSSLLWHKSNHSQRFALIILA